MKSFYNAMGGVLAAMALTAAQPVAAAEPEGDGQPKQSHVDISFNTRAEFTMENPEHGKSSAGFHGSYLNLMIKGQVNDKLSYSFRQRLNKFQDIRNDVFSATDWIYLTYKPTERWAVSGGKQILAVGGYEYDAAPIDIYYSSTFWQNIACYQFGVSATYTAPSGNHSLLVQMCNSPFHLPGSSCFAYNVVWNGDMGVWHTIWSANLMETSRGHFAQFIALGNRFNLGPVTLDIDLLNRHYEDRDFISNWSVIGKADYRISPTLNIFAKGGLERFDGDLLTDVALDKKPFASAGMELRPIKSYPGLRVHAVYGLTTYQGQNQHNFMLGATWNCNLLKR